MSRVTRAIWCHLFHIAILWLHYIIFSIQNHLFWTRRVGYRYSYRLPKADRSIKFSRFFLHFWNIWNVEKNIFHVNSDIHVNSSRTETFVLVRKCSTYQEQKFLFWCENARISKTKNWLNSKLSSFRTVRKIQKIRNKQNRPMKASRTVGWLNLAHKFVLNLYLYMLTWIF